MTKHVYFCCLIRLICAVICVAIWPCCLAQNVDASTKAEPTKPAVASTSAPIMDARKINIDGRPFRGAKDAKVTVAFFDDFQCPYSAQMYRTIVDDVMKDYRDRVKLVPVDTPRWRIHPWATHAAVNANCLAEQSNDAYWDFSSFVHQHQAAIGDDGASAELDRLALDRGERYQLNSEQLHGCIQAQSDASVKDSLQIAADAGVTDVPVLLINNQRLIGAVPAADVRQLIENVLHRVGQSDSVPELPTATQEGMKSGSAEPDFSLPRSSLDITPRVNTLDSNVFAHGRANRIETALPSAGGTSQRMSNRKR